MGPSLHLGGERKRANSLQTKDLRDKESKNSAGKKKKQKNKKKKVLNAFQEIKQCLSFWHLSSNVL